MHYDEITKKYRVKQEGGEQMNMSEVARLILGLRAEGWADSKITDLILWIAAGEAQYKPKVKE